MEFQTVIEQRKSVRTYDPNKKVTREQVLEIVNAASQAPSWKNFQPARYYCLLEGEMRERFAAECLPSYNVKNSENAALVVTTFVANRSGFNRNTGEPDNECGNGWGYYDLGLANENFLLKAKDLGLDTVVLGLRNAERIREMLNIPDTEIIVAVIALGYAAKETEKPKRLAAEDIVKFY